MARESCRRCLSRRDCWIRNVIECRTRVAPSFSTYDLVIKASRGECLLYTTEDDIMEV